MGKGVRVNVWGDYALFSRPELSVERYSYDVMTPSAARGILESVYWHPGLKWMIDRIYVMKPIQFTSIRRNEIKSKISNNLALNVYNGRNKELYVNTKEDIVQRSSTILRDVEYCIEAHFEMTDDANESDNEGKFKDILMRRLKKGECYHTPYFGCREFPVNFKLWEQEEIPTAYASDDVKDLGLMLYDMDYSDLQNIHPMFFHAVLRGGILELQECEVIR